MLDDIMQQNRNATNIIRIDIHYLNNVMRKVNTLEEELKQETIKRKF
jgi:hypothetical protein